MDYALLGWPADGPTLRLDHREFAYAGKFVTPDTGKAVVRDPDRAAPGEAYDRDVLAALSFSPDRVREEVLWFRYVDVHVDRRGEGLGARLCRYGASRVRDRGRAEVRIAVNNPRAYQALHKAGFGYTGEEAGLAELILSTGAPRTRARYQAGLDVFRDRDRHDGSPLLAETADVDPPAVVDVPDG